MSNLAFSLSRSRWLNAAIKNLGINRVVDWALAIRPLHKTTSHGFRYDVSSVPSLVVASELFSSNSYADAVRRVNPRTIVDLGANVGYFPVLVADITNSRAVRGIVVEPNPALIPSIANHLKANGLSQVRVIEAAVATGSTDQKIDFYINPSHISSSVSGVFNPLYPTGGRVRKISVPVVDIAAAWRQHFPDEPRVDLLKVDIEGAEMDFLRGNRPFLDSVQAVLIEWHKWICSFSDVSGILKEYGFGIESIYVDDEDTGIAYFMRSRKAAAA